MSSLYSTSVIPSFRKKSINWSHALAVSLLFSCQFLLGETRGIARSFGLRRRRSWMSPRFLERPSARGDNPISPDGGGWFGGFALRWGFQAEAAFPRSLQRQLLSSEASAMADCIALQLMPAIKCFKITNVVMAVIDHRKAVKKDTDVSLELPSYLGMDPWNYKTLLFYYIFHYFFMFSHIPSSNGIFL